MAFSSETEYRSCNYNKQWRGTKKNKINILMENRTVLKSSEKFEIITSNIKRQNGLKGR